MAGGPTGPAGKSMPVEQRHRPRGARPPGKDGPAAVTGPGPARSRSPRFRNGFRRL